jgi:hypothetical protein
MENKNQERFFDFMAARALSASMKSGRPLRSE